MIDPRARVLLDVARSVLSELDVEVVLGRVLSSARDLTSARYAAIGVLDDTRSTLARFITAGIDEDTQLAIGDLPTGRGVLGELIRRPEPLRVSSVKAHPRSYGFPPGHPAMDTFLGAPVMVGGEPFGNIYVTEKAGGGDFSDDDEEALVWLAAFAGLAIDHANRYTESESSRGDLQRTVDALDASIQIARALGTETDVDAVLALVAKRGRALVGARVLLIEALDGDQLVVAAGAGEFDAGMIGERVALAETVASVALRTGLTQRLEEGSNWDRWREHGLGRFGLDAAFGLVVPLVYRGVGLGVLVAIDRLDGVAHYQAEDHRLLESFAASAAIAVATAHSATDEQHRQRLAATEQERARWARELHDETIQGLASLRLMLDSARRERDPEALEGKLARAIDHIESETETLRTLITELRPVALDDAGTGAALEALAERMHRAGMEVVMTVGLAREQGRSRQRHTVELETAVYRIVQQALTNAGQHGGATHASVDIVEDETTVHVTVHDDGAGFDTAARCEGYGLVSMRERAQLLHGTLTITSGPGEGTTVAATLPVSRRSNAEQAVADARSESAGR
jgi:signal transduction histidine kinase